MFSDANNNLTISYKQTGGSMLRQEYRDILKQHGFKLLPAQDGPTAESMAFLRVTPNGLSLEDDGVILTFHPSMSLLRMINCLKGSGDRFLEAADLRSGDIFLDCTMGLASDTLIAATAVGPQGKVIAVEQSPLIYLLVRDGLRRLLQAIPSRLNNPVKLQAWQELSAASALIETVCAEHLDYLKSLPAKSVDVIYFDPMFRATRTQSSSIKPIKKWSNPQPLAADAVEHACRVARRRVVLKERRESGEFDRLGFEVAAGSKYSPINFGIIDLEAKGE